MSPTRSGKATPHPRASVADVVTSPLKSRENLVHIDDFARVPDAQGDMLDWMASLPTVGHRTNAASHFKQVVSALSAAREGGMGRVCAFGPHLIKYGLSPILIDLMKEGWFTALATTGAGAIHDVEIALIGATSEEMSGQIAHGRFGMAKETGELLAAAASRAHKQGLGYGQAIGAELDAIAAPHRQYSILWQAYDAGVPMTVHVALGTDIVHMHPSMNGAHTGAATLADFEVLAAAVGGLDAGGVHLNITSAVILPEVFLKCLTVSNNLRAAAGQGPIHDFMTVAMDQESRYRPLMNVIRRPTQGAGEGLELLGRVEILFPLLAMALKAMG